MYFFSKNDIQISHIFIIDLNKTLNNLSNLYKSTLKKNPKEQINHCKYSGLKSIVTEIKFTMQSQLRNKK